MKIFYLSILTALISNAYGAFEKQGIGASNIGLSLSAVASTCPDFTVFHNPALISGDFTADFFYRNYFGIKELNQVGIYSEFTSFDQPIAIGIARFGNNLYSETELVLGTSYKPNDVFSIGLSASVYILRIKNYGDALSFGLNCAVFYRLDEHWGIAATINNFNEPELGTSNEKIPVSGEFGFSYLPVKDAELLLAGYKEEFHEFAYRLGTRIQIIPGIKLLAGFQNYINSFSLGIELNQNNYRIKYSVDIHPVLNASHALGFSYVL